MAASNALVSIGWDEVGTVEGALPKLPPPKPVGAAGAAPNPELVVLLALAPNPLVVGEPNVELLLAGVLNPLVDPPKPAGAAGAGVVGIATALSSNIFGIARSYCCLQTTYQTSC
jgi:hypothetical protein